MNSPVVENQDEHEAGHHAGRAGACKVRPLDSDEPRRIAEAVARLGLQHVVVASVDRDDLADGGAAHFAATARAIKANP